jgi:Rieske 2Fe-2S family protein
MDATLEATHLLASRRPGYSLAQAFYNDPAIFELEMEVLFHRDWLFAGHLCELPNPGDFITCRAGRAEAIVIRTASGEVRAFHNTCRHRGSRICQVAKGSAPRLVCPYHQWTYDYEGRLLFARDMGPDFDPRQHALKPVHCESLAGYVFICFADTAPDFAPLRAQVEAYMTPHRLEDAKVAHQTTTIEKGNWKLVWENNRECYHCSGSHPELGRTFSDAPTITGIERADGDDRLAAHWRRCEAAGLPSTFLLSADGQYRVMRVPLERDAESLTLSGRPASAKPLGGLADSAIGSMLLFHYPTTWNHLLRDHAVTFQVMPLGPQETQLTTKWLVHKDAIEGVDYDLTALSEVWAATNAQDRGLVEQNQLGINSPAYEPGPYSPAHENGAAQFVDWYCAALAGRLSDSIQAVAAE